ncbi:MRPL9 (YGR220C) [Zygosaccharomyces parabailii]|nr:MRPL9 (YGR220C) [Zygosaccharomyces parabailii]CDH17871.1 probable 54S ribosomal protein L9, mitochondrial [Zygosaccharomyces bailii ISA1307]SJM83594.1 probable 54S ribosomal protein L9, mitochondrial [Zygosaccharomyces bailii]
MSSVMWSSICKPITFARCSSTRAHLIAPSVVSTIKLEAQPINHSPQQAQKRKWLPLRCGALSKKEGMMPFFDESTGRRVACTVLKLDNVEVLMHRTVDENGYFACQVGYGSKHPAKISRQMLGHFASKLVNPKEKVCEFRVKNEEGLLPVGTVIKPSFFQNGQFVDLRSTCKGKGFAGVMKKYHFAGLRASHGTSIMHRHGGSYGQNQDPGRILPGKKMPGHMGNHQVTIQNAQVMSVDDELGVILVKGSIAGAPGSFVKIQDAIKKPPATGK